MHEVASPRMLELVFHGGWWNVQGCKQASCVSEENKNSVCCCQTVCHRRKILPWLLQPNHWCSHWQKGMIAVTQSFSKIGQSIQSCHARMGCHVSLILFLSAPLSVCLCVCKDSKKGQWVKTPRTAFCLLTGGCQMATWHQSTRTVPGHLAQLFQQIPSCGPQGVLGKVVHAALCCTKSVLL